MWTAEQIRWLNPKMLKKALKKFSQKGLAKFIGIPCSTLQRRLKEYKIRHKNRKHKK